MCFQIRGVPKSGTTWLTAIVDKAFEFHCANRTSVDARCERCSPERIKKWKHESGSINPTSAQYLVIFRDSRDVAVSMYHWSPKGFAVVNSFIRSEYGIISTIQKQNDMHQAERKANALYDQYSSSFPSRTSGRPGLLHLFYETVHREPDVQLKRISRFLDLELSDNDIHRVLEITSFDAMRQQEASGEMHLKIHPNSAKILARAEKTNIDASQLMKVMTRRGEAGGWVKELDEQNQIFCAEMMKTRLHADLRIEFI